MTTGFRGVVFDVDGVLVDSPHEMVWPFGSWAPPKDLREKFGFTSKAVANEALALVGRPGSNGGPSGRR